INIRRASEHVLALAHIFSQSGILLVCQKKSVRVVGGISPVQPALNPTYAKFWIPKAALGATTVDRDDKFIVVVAIVHLPGQHDLPGVVHAGYRLGLDFGAAERRQQQRCKDGDNSDNDQQFDKGKGRLWRSHTYLID